MNPKYLNKEQFSFRDFGNFVKDSGGLSKVKKEDMDALIDHYGFDIVGIVQFPETYEMVAANESNDVMKKWTITTGVLTLIVTVATIVNLVLFIQSM